MLPDETAKIVSAADAEISLFTILISDKPVSLLSFVKEKARNDLVEWMALLVVKLENMPTPIGEVLTKAPARRKVAAKR